MCHVSSLLFLVFVVAEILPGVYLDMGWKDSFLKKWWGAEEKKEKIDLSAAPPISMDFCTIPTIGSDVVFDGLGVVFDFNWGLGGCEDLHPAC